MKNAANILSRAVMLTMLQLIAIAVALTCMAWSARAAELTREDLAALYAIAYGRAELPIPELAPTIHIVSRQKMRELDGCADCNFRGLVDTDCEVYIDQELDLATLYGRSIVVHELVHYLQCRALGPGALISCQQWRMNEMQAFNIQLRSLIESRALLGDLQRVQENAALTMRKCPVVAQVPASQRHDDAAPQPQDEGEDAEQIRDCLTIGARQAWGAHASFDGAPPVIVFEPLARVLERFRNSYPNEHHIPVDAIYVGSDWGDAEQRAEYVSTALAGWMQAELWKQKGVADPGLSELLAIFYNACRGK